MNEEWKFVKDSGMRYQVSSNGRVRSLHKQDNGTYDVFILKSRTNVYGYKMIDLYINKKKKTFLVHRLVAMSFFGNSKDKLQIEVNHIDGNKTNNSVSNLEWVSKKENIRHAFDNKLNIAANHEAHYKSKIDISTVDEIKRLYKTGSYTQSKLGKMFGLSQNSIWHIVNNKTWQ